MKKEILFAVLVIVLVVIAVIWVIPAEIKAPTQTGNHSTSTATTTPTQPADVVVTSHAANALITSPVTLTGTARGYYFEASFPIYILDATGKELGVGIAQAQSDWMTAEPVPFKAVVTFTQPKTATGKIVFKNDNPSGLPENDKSTELPVRFK